MRITWDTPIFKGLHMSVPDEAVMEQVEALHMLGFSPTVSIDSDTERV